MGSLLALAAMLLVAPGEDWVSRHGVGFRAETGLSQLVKESLSKELKNVDIVGLGETSHGISEMFKSKSSLIQFLVAEENYSLIMIEATVGETVYLNQFISGETTNIDDVLAGMPLWFFKVEEFRDLLLWLRNYNKDHENRVQLCGMEMQYVDRSLHQIKQYLDKVDRESAVIWEEFGEQRLGSSTAGAKEFYFLWQKMPDEVLEQHFQLLQKLRKLFLAKKAEYVSQSSEKEYLHTSRHISIIEQFVSTSMQSEESIKHQMRDYYMFLNLEWTRAMFANPKTVVWAHNEHIWKQAGNGGYDVLGRQLDRRYGSSYFAIGYDFGSGTYRAPSSDGWEHQVPKPELGTLSFRMSEVGKPDLLLNIRSTVKAEEKVPEIVTLRASSGGYTPMRNGVIQFDRDYSVRDRYDAILYIDKVSVPKMLK